ncbi:MAG: hypothetical protein P1P84_22885, partial [Deferrisomatales bacterium]|nr:hypothetical protein [Deferrisomatales bacterium]
PEHVQLLRRRVDEAVLVFDGDAAGRKAAFRSLDVFLAEGFAARGVILPPEHDPDSFVRAGGDLAPLVNAAPPLMELFLEGVAEATRGGVDGTVAAVDQVVPRLAAITDLVARDLYYRKAAEILGVAEPLLRQRAVPGRRAAPAGAAPQPAPVRVASDPTEKALLSCLVASLELRARFGADRGDEWLGDGPAAAAIRFVVGREEPAAALPVERAPEEARVELTEALVSEEVGGATYPMLVARLRLRVLEREARELERQVAAAERGGDPVGVTRLQRRKMALDGEMRRRQAELAGRNSE